MTPKEIDAILSQAAQNKGADANVDVSATKARILRTLRPVRPLAPTWVLVVGFLIMFVIVAVAGGAVVGMHGWQVLSVLKRVAIFVAVMAAAGFAAVACSREMRPAGGRRISGLAFTVAVGGLLVTFALLFHDYGMQKFVGQGVPCFVAGLSVAVPAVLLGLLLLRRGFVLSPGAAGIALGTLAGLAGLGGLELHCPNLKATHVMFWHVGVVVASGLIVGAAVGWWGRGSRESSGRDLP